MSISDPSYFSHKPVLLSEMLVALAPQGDKMYLDGTFGGGGYTKAILDTAPQCKVVGLDRDPHAHERGLVLAKNNPQRFSITLGSFKDLPGLFPDTFWDGIVFDFGVSSYQLDQAERGFSFQRSGPLDMRMGDSDVTAADIVNTYKEQELAQILRTYGEEPHSGRIARTIVEQRKLLPIQTTDQLAKIIHQAKKGAKPFPKPGIDPATLTFQALRIYVNDELRQIHHGLEYAKTNLKSGGRLVTVTFHSLEARLVKVAMADTSVWQSVGRAVSPTTEEIHANPRARSAQLRMAIHL